MFLKSLDIFGFKSFADRTHIDFSDGITALLGPNGCGKSNIVDAIKWVLAENKAKNLRATSKEDVIFNGTERRSPLNVAEVTLTMSNETGLLPLEESEIAIKRRLYRNGDNEYFINNKPASGRDILRLFMDTGFGKSAYSVMTNSLFLALNKKRLNFAVIFIKNLSGNKNSVILLLKIVDLYNIL